VRLIFAGLCIVVSLIQFGIQQMPMVDPKDSITTTKLSDGYKEAYQLALSKKKNLVLLIRDAIREPQCWSGVSEFEQCVTARIPNFPFCSDGDLVVAKYQDGMLRWVETVKPARRTYFVFGLGFVTNSNETFMPIP
jgi:hypothetical protein